MLYKLLIKPFLFQFEPEKAHAITVKILKIICAIPFGKQILKAVFSYQHPDLRTDVLGLHFPNPVGLAAGFDKNGHYITEMECLGYGFIEVGTVTPVPQAGNPHPRLFRLPKDEALINRMGFNNLGAEALSIRLKNKKSNLIIGGNIGKNKDTPNELAADDYEKCFQLLYPYVDYFVVNVSSPNTPGLRALQDKEPLTALLNRLQSLNNENKFPKPILLKIAPDLTAGQLDEIIEIIATTGIAGIIATNTTISRDHLSTT
ncbi:MAG TPA: quinone-dependent dihydroorotate dehydrogenase, partial [Saprospiraceae bacterium]|nr:quinone-dependent dihydroorotate dehydrogenase [Saprospiraceae bacterium]